MTAYSQMRCHFICIVWGDTFLATFTAFTLPSLLAPGNLPDWPYAATSQLIIYTPQQEWHQLQQHPVMAHLQRYIPVCWQPIVLPDSHFTDGPEHKYRVKAIFNQQALQTAVQHQAAWLQIIPDMIYAAGFLRTLAHWITGGKEVVLHMGPRLLDSCLESLQPCRQPDCLNVPAAMMMDVIFAHLHPEYQGYFWLAHPYTAASPAMVFYWNDATTLVAQTYSPEPLFLRNPRLMPSEYTGSLDGGYMQVYEDLLTTGQASQMIVTGGGSFLAFSLSPSTTLSLEWLRAVPTATRPTLGYLYTQNYYRSVFHDWAFAQSLTWTLTANDADIDGYMPLLSQAPWQASTVLRQMVRMLRQGEWQALWDYWRQHPIQAVLFALTDKRLFFWADLVAQALYKSQQWDFFVDFVTQFRGFLEAAPYFLPAHCPYYAAYLPYPQTIALYPAGWPGWEECVAQPFGIFWGDDLSQPPDLPFCPNGVAIPFLSSERELHERLRDNLPAYNWFLLSLPQMPDLWSDLLYRAEYLVVSKQLWYTGGDKVLLALLYGKPIWWV